MDNLYVQVGDTLMKQVVGIPMGVSCAPYLANLMLFMYELEYFKTWIKQHDPLRNQKAKDMLQYLSCCTRYIDDLWNPLVNEETFRDITTHIYPEWLPLGEPEMKGRCVNYLDMSIYKENRMWHSKLYDKTVELTAKGLKTNKFPHRDSKLTTRCKYNIITSQFHRFTVACTKTTHWLDAAAGLYSTFVKKKRYDAKRTDRYAEGFIVKHRQLLTIKPTAVKHRSRKYV